MSFFTMLPKSSKELSYYYIHWDGHDKLGRELPSGIYIARLRCATPGKPGLVTPVYTRSVKMVLLR